MKTITLATIALSLLAAVFLPAQNPPSPPGPEARVHHQLAFLTTVLSLTAAQQQQAATIFTNAAGADGAVHPGLRSAHQELAAAVKSNDSAGIEQAAGTIGNLIAQMTVNKAKAEAAFYQILSSEQQSKWSQLEEQGPDHFFVVGGPAPFAGVLGGPGGK